MPWGEITQVRNKGMWGKSGGITARLLYVSVDGRQLRLSGTLDDKGTTGTAGVVAAVAFIPVGGFFVTGTSAKIAAGSNVTGFLEEDLPVVIQSASPTPVAPVKAELPSASSNSATALPTTAPVTK